MADIDFVIGAKDQTSKPIASVEGSLTKLTQTAQKAGAATSGAMDRVSLSTGSLIKMTGIVAAATAGFRALNGALGGLKGSLNAFIGDQEAFAGLTDTLTFGGEKTAEEVEEIVGSFAKLSTELQKVYGVGDEVSAGLARQAAMLGVSSDQLDEVTKASIGLAHATGDSLEGALRKVMMVQEGEYGALSRSIPALRAATTETEKLDIVNQAIAKGLETKAKSMDRVGGRILYMKNAIGDLGEKIGELLAPAVQFAADRISELAEWAQTALVPVIKTATEWFIKFATAIEVGWQNLPAVFEMVTTSAQLQWERMKNITIDVFTRVLPAYFFWFGETVVKTFQNAFNAAMTVIENFATKGGDAILAIVEWVRSGMEGGLAGLGERVGSAISGSLLDGFKSVEIPSIPDMVARDIGEKEQSLQERLAMLGGNLAEAFNEKMKLRMLGLNKELDANLQVSLNQKKTTLSDDSKLQATESRLLTRGPVDRQKDAQERTAASAEKIAKQQAQLLILQSEQSSLLRELRDIDAAKPTLNIAAAPI